MILVFKLTALRNEFLELLKTSDMNIVGAYFGSHIAKIGREFICEHVTNNLKHSTNLGSFEIKRKMFSNGVVKSKTLVQVVLSKNLRK